MKIDRIDEVTFEVKGSDPEPYMIFKSINIGWTCTCMAFTLNIQDDGKGKDCKHIKEIKRTYNMT